jgi:hypothetical protein
MLRCDFYVTGLSGVAISSHASLPELRQKKA